MEELKERLNEIKKTIAISLTNNSLESAVKWCNAKKELKILNNKLGNINVVK